MASLRVHTDSENNQNVASVAGRKPQELAKNKRTVLGLVNGNLGAAKSNRDFVLQDKGAVKPKLVGKNVATAKLIPKGNGTARAAPVQQVQPLHSFNIFQDPSPDCKPVAALKNDIKDRALKDKKQGATESQSQSVASHAEYLQACLRPGALAPEPMSPASSTDSPMDVSLRSEAKLSKEAEAAQRELDYLNLTERLYMVDEYRDDISIYLRHLQTCHRPRKNYMARQPDITNHMRAVLVDWLVEVVEEYKMTNETLYLAVSYIDRFLSCMSVIRNKLQLVGTAAMFIASKYEEIYPPDVKDYVYITDDTYTKKQVLRMEHLILRILEFNLSVPTALTFLTDYTCQYTTPDNVKYLAMYLCELSLLQGEPFISILPSEVAAAALCVARAALLPDEEVLPPELSRVIDCELRDIIYVVSALETAYRLADTSVQQASRDKYKTDKYLKVACLPPPDTDCSSLLSSLSSASKTP